MDQSNPADCAHIAPGKRLLMEAAARLAARQGATSLVLREIAREAGLNHNTFYRHFDDLEGLMQAVVEDFARQLREGLTEARRSVPAGEPPTPTVVGWLFDFARAHRDVFVVAMRERHGPPGPVRKAVRDLLVRLREDMRRDLASLGYLPRVEEARLRRLLDVSVNEVFRHCLEYVEAPRRRSELLHASRELLETLIAGAAALGGRSRDEEET